MRIFIIGKKNIMQWPENVQKFLKGHETRLFLYNKTTPVSVFHKIFHRSRRYWYTAQMLKKQIRSFKPDLIFYVSSFFIPQECYDILNDFPTVPRIGWVSDAFGKNEKSKADFLDVLFCSDTGYLKQTKTFKSRNLYLPLCADETVFVNRQLPRTEPPFFAGVGNERRISYLKAIRDKCIIYGRRWPVHLLKQHEVHNYKLPHHQMQDFINKTIAPINMTFSKNIINGLNFRVFEVSACGGLILVNQSKDLPLCYEVGKEAVTYKTASDLNRLVHDIVLHPEKYHQIAEAGYRRTMAEHTYTKRLAQLLILLKELKIIPKEC